MKFKARLRRALAGAFAAILAVTMVTTAHAATTPGVDVVGEESTVTVHVFNNNNANSSTTGSGAAVDTTGFGAAIEGATLSYYKVGELVQYTTNGSTSLKYAVSKDAVEFLDLNAPSVSTVTIGNDNFYLCDAADLPGLLTNKTSSGIRAEAQDPNTPIVKLEDTGSTNEQGAVSVNGLSGLYLFVGKSMPSHVTTEIVPFFVSAPMPADGGWNTEVHVYPKVQTAQDITVLKQVRYASSQNEGDFTSSMSASAGTPLEYRITVTIPGDVKNLQSFSLTDTIHNNLELYDLTNVQMTTAGAVQLGEGDYSLQKEASAIRLELTSDGLNKFSSIQSGTTTITITYKTEIMSNAPLATAIGNPALLNYGFKSSQQQRSAQSIATVYTYGIDLTKTFKDSDTYQAGAAFGIYTDSDCKNAVAVSGSNGVYWVDKDGTADAMNVVQLSGTANGTLAIKGLATGIYYLKEVNAPDGYGRLQTPIEVTISEGDGDGDARFTSPTASVNGTSATIDAAGTGAKDGLVQLTVENQKLLFGFLPQTGEAGTLVATAAGIGMIALAIVFVAGRRSKASAR